MLSRRQAVAGLMALGVAGRPALARMPHGGSGTAINRIYLICYGQSNMDVFCQQNNGSFTPSAGTFFYNGTSLVAATALNSGSGIVTCMNAIKAATGLDVAYQNTAGGGEDIRSLTDPTNVTYIALVAQAQANILPTDAVFILWDQGEGDTAVNPHELPDAYIGYLLTLHTNIVNDVGLGLTKATCPFIIAALGTGGGLIDTPPNGGINQLSWHTIQNSQFNAGLFNPHMLLSHSNVDIERTDGFHYNNVLGTPKIGQRFAQAVNTLRGVTSGFAHWEIVSAQTVDATHTDITVQHSLGTDFTPTSGIQGFEVSGDNGASWDSTGTGVRVNATTIRLTHPSMSTTSARVVRYEYGFIPPNMSAGCSLNAACAGPVNAVFDNSALTVPLSPTTWDIRPAPLTNRPVPTWRDVGVSNPSHKAQNIPVMQLGPATDNYQKFLILASSFGQWEALTPATVTITPNIGPPVTATLVKKQSSLSPSNGTLFIYQALLNTLSNGAISCTIDFDYADDPFGSNVVSLYTVPFLDLSSTTATDVQGNNTTSTVTATLSASVSAGGFMIAMEYIDSGANIPNEYATISSNYAKRSESSGGLVADASNFASSGSTSFTTIVNGIAAGTIAAGSGYTPAPGPVNTPYIDVPLAGGSGTGARANITVSAGGTVTAVGWGAGGFNYQVGDVLTAAAADIGGTGSGFTFTVTSLQSGNITLLMVSWR